MSNTFIYNSRFNNQMQFALDGAKTREVRNERLEGGRGAPAIPKRELHRAVMESKASGPARVSTFPGKGARVLAQYSAAVSTPEIRRVGTSGRHSR